jgi:hypothetical protein
MAFVPAPRRHGRAAHPHPRAMISQPDALAAIRDKL